MLRDTSRNPYERLDAGLNISVQNELAALPLRDMVSPSATYPLQVDRQRALFGSWYEIFPRSLGAYFDGEKWVSGTLLAPPSSWTALPPWGFDVLLPNPGLPHWLHQP